METLETLISLDHVGRALNIKSRATVISACERYGIPIVNVSRCVRGITANDYATLIARARGGPQQKDPGTAGVDLLTVGEAALIDALRAVGPGQRDRYRFMVADLSAPSGDRFPQSIAGALAAVLAEPSLTAREAA